MLVDCLKKKHLAAMKKKNIAGILAFLGGFLGLHRFYLGQIGLGIAYLFLVPSVAATSGFLAFLMFIPFIDAIRFFTMDQRAFDEKYNKRYIEEEDYYSDRRERPRRAERKRYDYQKERTARARTAPKYEQPKSKKAAANKAKNNTALKEGIKKFKDYDYEGAIEDFEKALQFDPQHIATHFNLACAYSLIENKDKSFYHLDRAVALGFTDFETIKTRDHLAYIRIQDEFLQFESNGFRLAQQLDAPQDDLLSSQNKTATSQAPLQNDLLEQLHKLAQLKEKGLLTEEEFSAQKERLLR